MRGRQTSCAVIHAADEAWVGWGFTLVKEIGMGERTSLQLHLSRRFLATLRTWDAKVRGSFFAASRSFALTLHI